MPVPDFQHLMLPYMTLIRDGDDHSIKEMMAHLASQFSLTEDDLTELIPSKKQTRFYNRVTWAGSHLRQAKLVENVGRGLFRITARGQELLSRNPDHIDINVLNAFPEYQEFRQRRRVAEDTSEPDRIEENLRTPDELLAESYQNIRDALASEILEKVKTCSPAFFERLVVETIVAMGYGGTLQDAGKAVGKSNDGGIDGIIKEDRLGLDLIYLQAKKWESTVGRPELQAFAGALLGRQANKGVFITTSNFSSGAREFVKSIASNIILIDGEELAELMVDFNVGVNVEARYEIKRIDSDYFVEE
jgi:restriction system protein